MVSLSVNGLKQSIDAEGDTPLLWVLRDNLDIKSVKYACGIGRCGVCTVLLDNKAVRSCSIPVKEVSGREITTIEGLPEDHPVKLAWIEKQVPQCGYCQPGIMLQTVDFLNRKPNPSEAEVIEALDNVLCRCGSHPRIKKAVKMAAKLNQK